MALTRICSASELPAEGQLAEVEFGGRSWCLSRVNGDLRAMDNICPHRGGPLHEGWVEEGKVLCPWHAWTFDPKTGSVNGSVTDTIETFPVRIEGEDVFADLHV